MTPIKENITNEVEIYSDDRVRRGSLVGCAWNGSGPRRKDERTVKSSTKKKAVEAAPAPTAQEIADAQAKGMVWVNTSTKVYHKDRRILRKTKKGKFMTEDDAKKAGYKAAKEPAAKKAKTDAKK